MPGLFGADITTLSVVVVDDGYGDASLKLISDTFAFLQHGTFCWLFSAFLFTSRSSWPQWIDYIELSVGRRSGLEMVIESMILRRITG